MTRTKTEARTWAKAAAVDALRPVLGAVLVVAALHAVLAAPGFSSDRDGTLPARAREARR